MSTTVGPVPPRSPTTFRLDDDSLELLRRLAETTGQSQTAVIKLAIRKLARSEGVKLEPK